MARLAITERAVAVRLAGTLGIENAATPTDQQVSAQALSKSGLGAKCATRCGRS